MEFAAPAWLLPVIGSALALGLYDLCKKHAVRDNSVMPVLFYATLCGSLFYVVITLLAGTASAVCSLQVWWLILLKSLLVAASWTCVYYAMRELPISIASPIRASAPLWTFLGSLALFSEFPTLLQGIGMLAIFTGYFLFSVFGKLEGISFLRSRGIRLIVLGTLLGAASALYDKYLMNVLKISPKTVQFWFSIDLVFILGAAFLVRSLFFGQKRRFEWRWSIVFTGILLILADYLYFYAVSLPDIHISILSLVRRCSCIVTFGVGVYYFRDAHIKRKAVALVLILSGVFLLALAR
ncbi:MAG: EamA-like transporter family protein [Lentisphaerae bacterium ADurb.Bin242]|nr:MAG: EamA-like transporter family protein [Lentisphaerae bacterium ADurb.Bin242]